MPKRKLDDRDVRTTLSVTVNVEGCEIFADLGPNSDVVKVDDAVTLTIKIPAYGYPDEFHQMMAELFGDLSSVAYDALHQVQGITALGNRTLREPTRGS